MPGRIHVTDRADLGLALVGTGFSYDAGVRELQARVLTALLPRIRDIRRACVLHGTHRSDRQHASRGEAVVTRDT